MPEGIDQLEIVAERISKAIGIMSRYGKAAAFFWTIQCECADDNVPARVNCGPQTIHVALPLGWLGQEVEGGAVMPNGIFLGRRPIAGISNNPVNLVCQRTKVRSRHFQSCG